MPGEPGQGGSGQIVAITVVLALLFVVGLVWLAHAGQAGAGLPVGDARIEQAACKGCGCRGGPGWRIKRTGQCASAGNLRKECGAPPSKRLCTREN